MKKTYGRMASLCAKAEYCLSEIDRKLARQDLTAEERQEILDALVAGRFIDERRYAAAFVRTKTLYDRWGRRKTAMALKTKGLGNEDIAAGMSEVSEEEYFETAVKVAAAKARNIDTGTWEGRMKLTAYMVSRGFESDTAARALSAISDALRDP